MRVVQGSATVLCGWEFTPPLCPFKLKIYLSNKSFPSHRVLAWIRDLDRIFCTKGFKSFSLFVFFYKVGVTGSRPLSVGWVTRLHLVMRWVGLG